MAVHQQLGGGEVGVGGGGVAPRHQVHLPHLRRSAERTLRVATHHLVVRVDEVAAGVAVPAGAEAGPVLHPAQAVVHGHLYSVQGVQ